MTQHNTFNTYATIGALIAAFIVVSGLLVGFDRSVAPSFGFPTPVAEAFGGDGDGDGAGGGDGGGCCGGGDGGGDNGGDTGGDVTPPPPPPPPPPPTDLCPNLPGNQTVLPPGLIIDANGNCVPPPVNGLVCTLSPSATVVAPGGTVTLTWTSVGATAATLNPGGAIAVNGSQTVTINANTTYTATFTGPAGTITCSAAITVTTNPPPVCTQNCGGGGLNAPNVFLFRKPGEQPLAFVTLSQIPYTGYETGPLGVALFYLFLAGWSVFAAYLIAVKRLPMRFIEAYLSSNGKVNTVHIDATHEAPAMTHISAIAPSHSKPTKRMYSVYETAAPEVRTAAPVRVETTTTTKTHTPAAVASTPVALGVTSEYASAVPLFIDWIANGESEKAFNFLRSLHLTQKSAQDFMEKTVCELDHAYRCRVDSAQEAATATTAAIAHLSNTEIEKMIEALASAVDRTYGSDYTSAKIALVKALSVRGVVTEEEIEAKNQAHTTSVTETKVVTHTEEFAPTKHTEDYTDDFILSQINRI